MDSQVTRKTRKKLSRVLASLILAELFAFSFLIYLIIIGPPTQRLEMYVVSEPIVGFSPYVVEYELPIPNSGPMGIAVDDEGVVWIAATNVTSLISFNPVENVFRRYKIPMNQTRTIIWMIDIDSNGRLWFPSTSDNSVWSFEPRSGEFTRYELPSRNAFPLQLDIDESGRVWVAEMSSGKIAVIEPESGLIREYALPKPDEGELTPAPVSIVVDMDGVVWVSERAFGRLFKFYPDEERFEEVQLPEAIFTPVSLGIAPDGSLWFTDFGELMGSVFIQFDPSSGQLKRFSTSLKNGNPSLPLSLYIDNVGNVWILEQAGNRIAKFSPRLNTLLEYELPRGRITSSLNTIQFIVAQDRRVWFTEYSENKIGFIDTLKTIPFSVSLSQNYVKTKPGSVVKVDVFIIGKLKTPVSFMISGTLSPLGRIINATTSFSPSVIIEKYTQITTLTITLHDSIKPGNYTLTVGASDGQIISSAILYLEVENQS